MCVTCFEYYNNVCDTFWILKTHVWGILNIKNTHSNTLWLLQTYVCLNIQNTPGMFWILKAHACHVWGVLNIQNTCSYMLQILQTHVWYVVNNKNMSDTHIVHIKHTCLACFEYQKHTSDTHIFHTKSICLTCFEYQKHMSDMFWPCL